MVVESSLAPQLERPQAVGGTAPVRVLRAPTPVPPSAEDRRLRAGTSMVGSSAANAVAGGPSLSAAMTDSWPASQVPQTVPRSSPDSSHSFCTPGSPPGSCLKVGSSSLGLTLEFSPGPWQEWIQSHQRFRTQSCGTCLSQRLRSGRRLRARPASIRLGTP
jgi:hypothetical protein